MRFLHFIWDFDGTLFDSYDRITRAMMKALEDFNISADFSIVKEYVKRSIRCAAQNFSSTEENNGATEQKIMEQYHVHSEEEDFSSLQPYPDTKETLQILLDLGGNHFLYTHRGMSAIEALKREKIDSLFQDFITGADGFPPKPAPDAISFLLKKYQLDPAHTVMIGDRQIDILAGISAGTAGIVFDADGYACSIPEALQVVHSMKELQYYLRSVE